ncbi:trypsin-like peptidase domain-containing protein [Actinomadura sp. BRA 177]|nr:trypsin-like peptidase domain-containing protein [Actinomadura sp. BRA 177]
MDYRRLFSSKAIEQEFLDRFDELAASAAAIPGFEGLEGGLTVDRAADAVAQMNEGTWASQDPGLEAIVEAFLRPVHLVQRCTFRSAADGLPKSEEIAAVLEEARSALEAVIPSVGRIDLHNHRNDWVGTGWMVEPGTVVTNRHVAEVFAERTAGFAFRHISGRTIRATLDWYHEHLQPEESRFRVTEVVWMEPDASLHDVALLRIAETGEDGEPLPPPIPLMTEELAPADVGRWIGVIGYPGRGNWRDSTADRQRIFDGVYECKRLAAGQLTSFTPDGLVAHDATTLGGNSGSAVIDLATGKAVALHFAGVPGMSNHAVRASVVQRLVRTHNR